MLYSSIFNVRGVIICYQNIMSNTRYSFLSTFGNLISCLLDSFDLQKDHILLFLKYILDRSFDPQQDYIYLFF